MSLVIHADDPRAEDVRAMLQRHLAFAHRNSPADHVHALDGDALLEPAVTFFSARLDGAVVGVGALRHLDEWHGELKSMHTLESARGRGVGRAMIDHLLALARDRGYRRVSLETGTGPAFVPAQSLYTKLGFRPCPPFGEYTVNAYSVCMTKYLI
jgi:putative acetyltransferase